MCDKLREKFDQLTTAHPDLKRELEAGFLLALGGSVKATEKDEWTVSGGTTKNGKRNSYTVAIFFDWQCDCKANEFSAPSVEDFDGHKGKICKHIAAVALSRAEPLEPVASVFEFLARLVAAQWLPKQGEPFTLPGTKVKVWQRDDEAIALKQGHKTSKALIEQHPRGGDWDFTGEDRHFVFIGSMDSEPTRARVVYDRWVKSLGGNNEQA